MCEELALYTPSHVWRSGMCEELTLYTPVSASLLYSKARTISTPLVALGIWCYVKAALHPITVGTCNFNSSITLSYCGYIAVLHLFAVVGVSGISLGSHCSAGSLHICLPVNSFVFESPSRQGLSSQWPWLPGQPILKMSTRKCSGKVRPPDW